MEELTDIARIISIVQGLKDECKKYEISEETTEDLIRSVVEEMTRQMVQRREH